MFTGIILESAIVQSVEKLSNALKVSVNFEHPFFERTQIGDSIALNGVCLTLTTKNKTVGTFDVSAETLAHTNFANLKTGEKLHVEPALRMGDPLGGHLVTGHVEAKGLVVDRRDENNYLFLKFKITGDAQKNLAPALVTKGSIAIDGVSLTVNEVFDAPGECCFTVYLIPHTLEVTQLGKLEVGDFVHLESDILAKYVQRSLELRIR